VHEELLPGGNSTRVSRVGETVRRATGPWTPAVHELLAVLRAAGIDEVPEPLGVDDAGREVLSYLPGVVGHHPLPDWLWRPSVLEETGALLRRIHDASVPLVGRDAHWQLPTHEPAEVICHNDFAPYNLVFDAESVVGAIDWDFASPGPRLWDLAYLAYRIVPLTMDDWGDGFSPVARDERLRRLLRAYGVDSPPREVLTVLSRRLVELADFTDRAAERLSRPDMEEHARLYRRDAAQLSL
jgi:hypothetical protein